MLVFLTIYIFILRQIVKLIGGNIRASCTSLFMLPTIFLTSNSLYDIFMLILVFFSSLHHSKNGKYKIFETLDSTFIVGVVSSILLTYWTSIGVTLFTFFEKQILETNIIKFMFLGLCNLYILLNHYQESVYVYFNTISFFLWKMFKPNLLFRIQWHLSCSLLLFALIPIIQKDNLLQQARRHLQ